MHAAEAEQAGLRQSFQDHLQGPQTAGYWRLPLPDEQLEPQLLKIGQGRDGGPSSGPRHIVLWLQSKDNRQRLMEANEAFIVGWAESKLGKDPRQEWAFRKCRVVNVGMLRKWLWQLLQPVQIGESDCPGGAEDKPARVPSDDEEPPPGMGCNHYLMR